MNVATIHHTLVKEAHKENKVHLREIKQLRPKSEGSKELVLVSAAPEPNRHDRRVEAAILNRWRRKNNHVLFVLRQWLKHRTMHQLPKAPLKIYRNAFTSAQVATAG